MAGRACTCARARVRVDGARDGITIIWASTTERVGGTVAVRHIVINLVPSALFHAHGAERVHTRTGTGAAGASAFT